MLLLFNSVLSLFMFICGGWVFVAQRKHLLLMLLSLEFMVLSLFMILFSFLSVGGYELFFSMVFLTCSVCEGALGLSVLVSMIRSHGNDFFQSFSVLQC